jgi:hypothetical protein
MNGFLNILKEAGRYIAKNSIWLIPLVKSTVETVKELFNHKKDKNGKSEESGEQVDHDRDGGGSEAGGRENNDAGGDDHSGQRGRMDMDFQKFPEGN